MSVCRTPMIKDVFLRSLVTSPVGLRSWMELFLKQIGGAAYSTSTGMIRRRPCLIRWRPQKPYLSLENYAETLVIFDKTCGPHRSSGQMFCHGVNCYTVQKQQHFRLIDESADPNTPSVIRNFSTMMTKSKRISNDKIVRCNPIFNLSNQFCL